MTTQMKLLVAALALSGFACGSVAIAADAPTMAQMAEKAQTGSNWFGGPIYSGAPMLEVTAALVEAGGGATDFNFATALVSMLGKETVDGEVAKLTKQYGEKDVTAFIDGMTFAVKDGLKRATEAGVKLPPAPAELTGAKLAEALVTRVRRFALKIASFSTSPPALARVSASPP